MQRVNENVKKKTHTQDTGADPGFPERRFVGIKVWGLALLIYLIFLKYPMEMK